MTTEHKEGWILLRFFTQKVMEPYHFEKEKDRDGVPVPVTYATEDEAQMQWVKDIVKSGQAFIAGETDRFDSHENCYAYPCMTTEMGCVYTEDDCFYESPEYVRWRNG